MSFQKEKAYIILQDLGKNGYIEALEFYSELIKRETNQNQKISQNKISNLRRILKIYKKINEDEFDYLEKQRQEIIKRDLLNEIINSIKCMEDENENYINEYKELRNSYKNQLELFKNYVRECLKNDNKRNLGKYLGMKLSFNLHNLSIVNLFNNKLDINEFQKIIDNIIEDKNEMNMSSSFSEMESSFCQNDSDLNFDFSNDISDSNSTDSIQSNESRNNYFTKILNCYDLYQFGLYLFEAVKDDKEKNEKMKMDGRLGLKMIKLSAKLGYIEADEYLRNNSSNLSDSLKGSDNFLKSLFIPFL